jgi:replicative DNA helicase
LSYLYNTLDDLHTSSDKDLSVDEFILAFNTKYPDADRKMYGILLEQLQAAQIDQGVGEGILKRLKERVELSRLSDVAYKVASGSAHRDELLSLIDSYTNSSEETLKEFPIKRVSMKLGEMLDHIYKNHGYRWRLDCLNKSLGSLRPGDFGFIFARPETGKTTFLSSEITHFLTQSTDSGAHNGRICWFNNEEDGDKVGLRIIQAYYGVTLDVLTAKRKHYEERFEHDVGDRFHLFDAGLLNKRDVESIIKSVKPGIVIYDQIDKVRGFTNDRDDLRLGAIYQWARELAKGSHAAIGVCQADGHAEGVRYLTMEHVANAKTSKQAEADFIIGIGCQHNSDQEYIRYLNISKNKLFGDEDSIPDLRHGRFEVLIEPHIARYKDIIKFD